MKNEKDDDSDMYEECDDTSVPSSQESVRFENFDVGSDECKVFNDPIHGHILLHPLLVKIIDTPQFQRLRNVKQLGATYFVYPGGSHNRFEHCIGVSYLAEKLTRMLKNKQKNLNITEKDILCVAMAGLCHDLGHGPFSHLFDGMFLPQVIGDCAWHHEKGSCVMLEHLIKDNNLKPHLDKYDIDDDDVIFVKEMIAGPLEESKRVAAGWPYLGRGEEKSFLYEIVSNERNKVDVDKWDYFARDCHHLGIRNSFDHNRFMQFIKVLRVEGEQLQICARDKECFNLYEMFHTRSALHKRAYRHKVASAIELMITKAFVIADPYIKIPGTDDKPCRMSECIYDPVAFTKLNDNIFDMILHSTVPEMKPAREILKRIQKRELYTCIGVIRQATLDMETSEIPTKIAEFDDSNILKGSHIIAKSININYGMHDRNPVDSFRFFSKSNPTRPYQMRRDDISNMLPSVFEDREIEVYCIDHDKTELATECFQNWSGASELKVMHGNVSCDRLTPIKRSGTKSGIEITKRKKLHI